MSDLVQLRGSKVKAILCGRKCHNGAPYSATIETDVEDANEGETIYSALHDLIDHLEATNAEMEHPDSVQITLLTPEYFKRRRPDLPH